MILLSPLRDISMAITSASGAQPTDRLADPARKEYISNGFSDMLLFVKSMSEDIDTLEKTIEKESVSKNKISLEQSLDNIQDGIILMNSDGSIIYSNKSAPVIQNTNGELELALLFENNSFYEWLSDCIENSVHAKKVWERIADKPVGEENRRIFNITAQYDKGNKSEVVIIAHDCTNIYRQDDDDLEFISFAAHELRGPITVIRGYLDVLDQELDNLLDKSQKELITKLIVSSSRLSSYINNVLNTSKYDRRHLKLNISKNNMNSIYSLVQDDLEMRARSQSRNLSINIPNDLPAIAADRSSLSEVLLNLIDNGIKYSHDNGTVTVKSEVDGNFIKTTVSDNGIGIPNNVIGHLFQKFYRSHRSREIISGTGIGLYLCRAIVESHGGKIGVTSTEGIGSTFWFTIPIYDTIADKLQTDNFTNTNLITSNEGWIKNHSKFSS